MLRSRSARLLATGLGLLMALAGLSANAHAQEASPEATPQAISTAAVYLTIENSGDTADRLLGGSTPAASSVELHATTDDSGVQQMREQTDGIEIPAGETVTFDPGGYHVMLVGLTADLRNGDSYELTLDFATAGSVTITVQVRPLAAPLESVPAPAPVTAGALTISDVWTRPAPALLDETSTPSAAGGATNTQTVGELTVTLTTDGDAAGPRDLSVMIVDASGAPVTDATVTFRTKSLTMDHGTNEKVATMTSPGVYAIEQVPMGMVGDWQTEVTIERPGTEPVVVIFGITLRGPS